ncbi:MAG: dihydroneopterin aldolase [Nitrospinota bacterium]
MEKGHIIIRGLEVQCILGVYDSERKAKRPVVIDLEFPLGDSSGEGPHVPSVDYAQVAGEVKAHVQSSSCHLMEELAEEVASLCLSRFSLERMKVRLSKPGAIPDAQTVILEIERTGPP